MPVDDYNVGRCFVDDEAGAREADEPVEYFKCVVGGHEERDAGQESDGQHWNGTKSVYCGVEEKHSHIPALTSNIWDTSFRTLEEHP